MLRYGLCICFNRLLRDIENMFFFGELYYFKMIDLIGECRMV